MRRKRNGERKSARGMPARKKIKLDDQSVRATQRPENSQQEKRKPEEDTKNQKETNPMKRPRKQLDIRLFTQDTGQDTSVLGESPPPKINPPMIKTLAPEQSKEDENISEAPLEITLPTGEIPTAEDDDHTTTRNLGIPPKKFPQNRKPHIPRRKNSPHNK